MSRLITLFLLFGLAGMLTGQNPFDIKKPDASKNKPAVKKEEVKKNEAPVQVVPPAQTTKTEPLTAPVQSAPVETIPAPFQKTGSTSANIFDIKAGGNPKQVILNKPSPNPPGSRPVSPGFPSVQGTSAETALVDSSKTTGHKQPASEAAGHPAGQPAGADMDVLQKKLKSFGTNTTDARGAISKNAWFVIYIFLFLLAAIAINFNRSYPASLLKATYNQNQLRILFKDASKGNHMIVFSILYFLFVINAGIFIYQTFQIFQIAPLSLLVALLIVVGIYLVRHLVLYLMGKIFPMEKETMFFNYTIGIHNLTAGLGLMVINILLSFVDSASGKTLIIIGLCLIGLLYAMRQVRGLLNNLPIIVSRKLHFIIYLCAVEIAPWMLLVRYFTL